MEDIRRQIRGQAPSSDVFRERDVISILVRYLRENDWEVQVEIQVKGGKIDIGAEKEGKILLIEAKGEDRGPGGTAEMNFQVGLGQLMMRMKQKEAEYGLAFPLTNNFKRVLRKYRENFAFEKLGIYLIPVTRDGTCQLISPNNAVKFLDEIAKMKLT
ncbi:MAG: hypothetical protein OEY88_06090 [Candidatus Bathyarchaeota archaeon]|nr:hypothetical protein [Candidatus Bathyarchaeota archaeon]